MVHKQNLINLFKKWAVEDVESITPLPKAGSTRKHYRIKGKTKSAIGTFNPEEKENVAFITFGRHFKRYNLLVPEIYSYELSKNIYLQEDLGDQSFYNLALGLRKGPELPSEIVILYKRILDQLPKFQIVAGKYFDYNACYPRSNYDHQSMFWDLNYFKYYFLKFAKIQFDEQRLEEDFYKLVDFLLQADSNFFMYRNFQSKNIIINEGQTFFIDYQGGRKGPLQYDVASLLFEPKANIPIEMREELLNYYMQSVQQYIMVSKDSFLKYYFEFALINTLQVMGVYGFQGFYEKNEYYLTSIPFAVENLKWIFENKMRNLDLPELNKVIEKIIYNKELQKYTWENTPKGKVRIRINSFSYFDKEPEDLSGNNGGYVFDCRSLHNPGRYDKYRDLTGLDREVILFLENDAQVIKFLDNVYALIDSSIMNYLSRGFTDLMVSFGCTGGQHRSVFAAEKLANHIRDKFKISVEIFHIKLEKSKILEPIDLL